MNISLCDVWLLRILYVKRLFIFCFFLFVKKKYLISWMSSFFLYFYSSSGLVESGSSRACLFQQRKLNLYIIHNLRIPSCYRISSPGLMGVVSPFLVTWFFSDQMYTFVPVHVKRCIKYMFLDSCQCLRECFKLFSYLLTVIDAESWCDQF